MSENKKEIQDASLNLDSFDDEDDLWSLQSDQENDMSVDIDGFDEEKEPINVTETTLEENQEIVENVTNKIIEEQLETINEDINEQEEEIEETEEKMEDREEDMLSSLDNLEQKEESIKLLSNSVKLAQNIENVIVQKEESNQEENEAQTDINLLIKNGLKELEEKRENLENQVAKLEHRRDKIEQEMKKNFAGVSQDLAIRVQGFKDYLVGSLQDLTAAAEQLELSSSGDKWEQETPVIPIPTENKSSTPQFAEQSFNQERKEIRRLLDQYRTRPDYYGSPWQLRRTFEPIHAQKVGDWFFEQGGRGALPTMGSRLQNILIGSAIISILSHLYGDRSRVLILADTPEKLGEWRRGLQDCLGISRSDFGPSRGVILFETASALVKKGDQITQQKDLPLIIMDLDDDRVSLSLLKFPLWLAFAPESPMSSPEYYY